MTNENVNIPELRKEVEWVEEQDRIPVTSPEREWYQRTWELTKEKKRALIAFAKRRGYVKEQPMKWSIDSVTDAELAEVAEDCGTAYCVAGHLKQRHDKYEGEDWTQFGARVLGIDTAQASRLFGEENDAADIRRIAEELAGERL